MSQNHGIFKKTGLVALLLAAILVISACKVIEVTPPTETPTQEPTVSVSETQPEGVTQPTENSEKPFSNSDGIAETGYWEGVKALDVVELPDYKAIKIPAQTVEVTDEALQAEIDNLLASFVVEEQVTDRPVADGDTINIDYVGSVDGVAFENGSTQGAGTEVTIGVTQYIDDFLQQLIGHTPGETFDIQVTFPDPYQNNTALSGKEAVFNVTINYITETITPELTDKFVSDNLTASYGWTNVEAVRTEIKEKLRTNSTFEYIQKYLVENSTVTSTPQSITSYLEKSLLAYYQDYAASYGMAFEDFLASMMGIESADQLVASYSEETLQRANYYMIMQAIAEDLNISVSTEDLSTYFEKYMDTTDYSSYETTYGLPYLKQVVLFQTVLDYMAENAIVE